MHHLAAVPRWLPAATLVLAAFAGQARANTAWLTIRVLHEGAPVRAAVVESGGSRAVTDLRGETQLALPPGSCEIHVERAGFRSVTWIVEVLVAGNAPLVVRLQDEPLEEEAIVVTATRSGIVVSDQAIRVETVPEEEIEENLTIQPGNLSTLLNEIAGVRMESTAPGIGGAALTIRGLPGRLTEVLSDGLPLIGTEPGGFGLLQTPPLDLERVEVIKGAASALYGGSALGGVLNLVSRRPGGEPELLLSRTSQGGSDAVGFATGDLGRGWGVTATGGASLQERRELDGDAWLDLARYERYSLRPRLYYEGDPGKELFLTAGIMHEQRDGGSMPGGTLPDGTTFVDALRTQRADGGLVGRVALADGRVWSARVSVTSSRHQREFGAAPVRDRQSTLFAETTLAGHWRGHSWVAGAAFERDRLRSSDAPAAGYSHSVPAAFVQDEYAVSDRLVLAASGRVDAHDDYGTFVSPRFSALYRPAEGWSLRASFGSGFAAPTPFVDEVESAGLGRLLPLSGLRAERAKSASVDLQRSAGHWEVDLSLFGSEIRHLLRVQNAASPGWLEIVNAGGTRRAQGAEAFLRYAAGALHVIGSYTWLDVTEAAPGGGRRRADRVPSEVAELAFLLEDEARGRAGIEFSWTGRQALVGNPYRVAGPGFLEVNALAELKFGETAVFLNAINLTDERQGRRDPLLLPAPGPGGIRIMDLWAPVAGRVYNLGVRLEF